jgi:hypothetical protein
MKFFAASLLLATVALATPAPAPEAVPEAASIAEPAPAPALYARHAGIILDSRASKKPKGGGGNNNENTTDSDNAAYTLTPSRVLQLGAVGVGVMEVVRLWG